MRGSSRVQAPNCGVLASRSDYAAGLIHLSLSIVLLPVMEVEAVGAEGIYYGERIFGELAVALRTSNWLPALLATWMGPRHEGCGAQE